MKTVKYLCKFMVASFVAVIILSLIFSVYYLVPLRVENPDRNTDYKWESGAPWIRMEEGISAGRYDENGFNNAEVVDNPDILILGSSHMEAANVPQDANTSFYLSQMLDGEMSVYNMGISGHTFAKICQYMPQTLEVYDVVPKYIVIETSGTSISQSDADSILNHTVPVTKVSDNQMLNLLQHSPFLRVMYYQLDGGLIKKMSDTGTTQTATQQNSKDDVPEKTEIDKAPYDEVFGYLETLQEEYNTLIVIFYHPTEQFNADGTVSFPHDDTYDVFAESASGHNIAFVDTTAEFEAMYAENYSVPHGFITGKLGEGHLNTNGHYAVAKSLYQAISEWEEADDANH